MNAGIADSWVSNAPPNWTRGRLKDMIGLIYNGVWGDDPLGDGTDVPCIRSADFDRVHQRAKVDSAPLRNVDQRSLRQHTLRRGDLVLEKSGGGEKQPVGMAVLFDETRTAVCSNFCSRIGPAPDIEPRFLAYVFATAYSQGLTQAAIKQTTGIQNLDTGALLAAKWTYPGFDEQRHIADFLDAETAHIDRLVSARTRQQQTLEEHRYADVSETLFPGITQHAAGLPPWPWLPQDQRSRPLVRLGYVCRLQGGITVDGSRTIDADSVTRPYLRVANVQADHIDLTSIAEVTVPRSMANRSTLRPGDVLVTEGGDLDKLGRGTVWDGQIPGCLHQNHVFSLRPEPDRLDPRYLALTTQTLHGRAYFESTGSKTTNLASTSSSKILSFPIPLPSLTTQRRLARNLGRNQEIYTRTKRTLSQQLNLLLERRQALIAAAVTGQIDVSTASGRGVTEGTWS